MLCPRCLRASVLRRQTQAAFTLSFSTTAAFRNMTEPKLSTPVSQPGEAPREPAAPVSSCPEGTILKGLNYMAGQQDPVAKKDDEYPPWLWKCLEVMKKGDSEAAQDVGDEFSKSKKQRRAAAKRKKALEDELLAGGDVEALIQKVPLQHQSINLPGEEGGSIEDNVAAAEKRQELKQAMRKERRAKIKESNYLKSM